MKVDLHIHSDNSDGTLDVRSILNMYKKKGYQYISFTDHDNIDAYNDLYKELEPDDPHIIPGVEISTTLNGRDVHILGYNFEQNKELISMLSLIKDERILRAEKIIRKLYDLWKFSIDMEQLMRIAGDRNIIGRPHIARALLEKKYVSNYQQAFDEYIGDKCQGFVPKQTPSPKEVIAMIKKSKGIPVLAHPILLNDDFMVLDLIEMGIMGIEAYYIKHLPYHIKFYRNITEKYNLIYTGGTDFHGLPNDIVNLGSYSAPFECVEMLYELKEKMNNE